MAKAYPLFRKTWMRVPIQGTVFCGAAYCANQLQVRYFPKLSYHFYDKHKGGGIGSNIHLGKQDLISKFRIFENNAVADSKQ